MKKLLSTLLALVIMATTVFAVPFSAHAVTPAFGSLGDNITYTFDSETGVMTVTGTGATCGHSGSHQFGNNNTEIKKLIIGEGITDIGRYCFSHLTALTEIEFPSTLQTIGFYSFGYCSSLTELSFPDSVTSLSGCSFGYCPSLQKITIGKGMKRIDGSSFDTTSMLSFSVDPENQYYSAIDGNLYNANGSTLYNYCAGKPESEFTVPESVTSIKDYAFSDCEKGKSALTKVVLPTGLKSLGTTAFRGASSLTEIVLPEGLEKIGSGAFMYCSGLTSIKLPSTLVSVAGYAFEGTNITSLTLPASLTTVDGFSFSRMDYLEEFIVENDNPALKAVDGVLFSKDGKTLFTYPKKKANTSYEIPEGVEIISASAFLNSAIKSIVFPSTLKRIEQFGLQSLALEGDITIPESVTYIGYMAFQGCNSISSITVSNPYAEIYAHPDTLGPTALKKCSYNKCDGSKSTTEEYCEKYSMTYESLGTASHEYGGFASNGDETHSKVCVHCGDKQTASCTLETLPAKEATCTEAGYEAGERCSVCGYSKEGEAIEPLRHDLKIKNETITPATCSAEGLAKITTTCSRCSYEKIEYLKLSTTSHTPKILEAVAPTCTQDGLTEGKQCSVCGDQIVAQIKQLALGHSFTNYVSDENATCTEDGTKTAKCDREGCDETDTVADTGSALGHTETVDPAEAPTCTAAGKTEGKHCSVCNAVLVAQTVVPAKGHTETVDPAVAPTCTAAGKTEGKHCSVCNAVLVAQTVVPATGNHTGKTVITPATLTADGKKVTTCTVCNKTLDTTAIAKIASVKLSATKYTYDGKVKTPSVTVKDSKGKVLKKGTDYTVSYASGRKNTGKYTVTVTFTGDYTESKTLSFNILPGKTSKLTATQTATSIKASWKAVTGASGYKVILYTAKNKTVKTVYTTKTTASFTKLSKGTTYKVKVYAYKTIDGKKVYASQSALITTTTAPGAPTLKATAGAKKATLSWNKQTGASGYVLYMATSKNGKYSKIATLKGNSKVSFTKTGLSKGKTCYFKVKAYKTLDGKTVYGDYSAVKSAKIK